MITSEYYITDQKTRDMIAKRLDEKMKEKGLSQRKLAKLTEAKDEHGKTYERVTRPTISNYLKGCTNANPQKLAVLCEVLGVDMDYFTGKVERSTHNIQFICDYTGLSEKAVKVMHSKSFDLLKAQLLSVLLTESNFLDRISDYWSLTKTNLDFVKLEYTERKIVDHEIVDDLIKHTVHVRTDMKVNDLAIGEKTFKEVALRLIQDELEKVISKH